jgi:hypothetical protein
MNLPQINLSPPGRDTNMQLSSTPPPSLDGVTASEAGCTKGRVFNPVIQQCDSPPNVPGREASKAYFAFEGIGS